jgi:hypothetical protein
MDKESGYLEVRSGWLFVLNSSLPARVAAKDQKLLKVLKNRDI